MVSAEGRIDADGGPLVTAAHFDFHPEDRREATSTSDVYFGWRGGPIDIDHPAIRDAMT